MFEFLFLINTEKWKQFNLNTSVDFICISDFITFLEIHLEYEDENTFKIDHLWIINDSNLYSISYPEFTYL